MIHGRLTAHWPRYTHSKNTSAHHKPLDIRESLSVTVDGGVPSVSYELVDATQQVTYEFSDGDQVKIQRQPAVESTAVPLTFSQGSNRLVLEIGQGDSLRRYTASSFWHLMLAQPQICQEHLLPLLQVLRSHWPLAEEAQELEDSLLLLAESGVVEQREKWALLVDQLRSVNFKQRQAADQELRLAGPVVLSYLSQLDHSLLNAEQRYRVRRIVESLTTYSADAPERVAATLLADNSIWLILLCHEDLPTRQLAAVHLSHLHGRSLDFDPAGDTHQRHEEIARLRSRLRLK